MSGASKIVCVCVCVCVCSFCSVFRVCLPRAIGRFNIWNLWNGPSSKQSISIMARLTMCLLVVFGLCFVSTCLPVEMHVFHISIIMLANKGQNISSADYRFTSRQTMMNSPKENAPLRPYPAVETPTFDPDQVLRSCIALFFPLMWCLEFLARCQKKKKHIYSNDSQVHKTKKQTPSFDRAVLCSSTIKPRIKLST